MIYIGSDHGGFKLKEELKKFLKGNKVAFIDVGPAKLNPKDDYPQYASKVAKQVQKSPGIHKGILLCRSGQGVCIVANKFKRVRAALAWNEAVAKASRHDDDVNVLCLPSDYISAEAAEDIVKVWLRTGFAPLGRYQRRIDEIKRIENK